MEQLHFANKRRSDRVLEAIPTRFAIASEDYQVEHEGFTMDRSVHGLRIRTVLPLACEEAVLVLAMGRKRGAIPARVVWVQGAEFSFDGTAGLEFLDALPT